MKFQFTGIEERDRRFQIFDMSPVDVEKVRQLADDTIASDLNEFDFADNNICNGYCHSTKCKMSVDYFVAPQCIVDEVEAARQRKRKLGMLHQLKECVQNPLAANGKKTLEGMAQGSCIYDPKYVQSSRSDGSSQWV